MRPPALFTCTGVLLAVAALVQPLQAQQSPAAPTNLRFTASGTTVSLFWLAPAAPPVPTSYVIEAGSAPGLTNLARVLIPAAPRQDQQFTIAAVAPGRYYVRLRSALTGTESPPSNEVEIVVGPACPGPPAAPTDLTVRLMTNTLLLSWVSGGDATSFVLEAGSSPALSDLASFDTGSSATSFTVAVPPPAQYYVRVRARNPCGTGAPSNEIVIDTRLPGPSETVLFTTLGANDSYDVLGAYLFTDNAVAHGFTASRDGRLDRIDLALSLVYFPYSPMQVEVSLADDAGNVLEVMGTVTVTGRLLAANPLFTLRSATQPLLRSGARYWVRTVNLGPQTGGDVGWNLNSIGASGPQSVFNSSFHRGQWSPPSVVSRTAAFRVVVR